jgi:hypothetical protein
VLFSSHILSEVEALCERVIVIAQGTLVAEGSAPELAEQLGARQRVVVRVEAPPEEVRACLAGLGDDIHGIDVVNDAFVIEAPGTLPLARRSVRPWRRGLGRRGAAAGVARARRRLPALVRGGGDR